MANFRYQRSNLGIVRMLIGECLYLPQIRLPREAGGRMRESLGNGPESFDIRAALTLPPRISHGILQRGLQLHQSRFGWILS